ncbi:hypothetical protein MNBD_PLANCTO03-2347 [hydrothermal vent metagenome]|uniref:Cytochrome oxidase biogenesis protein Sco1/SenC/PrrC, thiol-disulfide reductase involved in Cu(I) insertion into CoxII Cu(A) center n=1 Tax=hydrothermal vent metagenome TaxID=652676 RepID=A0A3B1E8V0_9ZZZZ
MNIRRAIWGVAAGIVSCLAAGSLCAQPGGLQDIGSAGSPNVTPQEQEGIGVVENLGGQIPLDLVFTNADGKQVELGSYFNQDKPVILAMVYYDCPIVCAVVMGKLTAAFKGIDFAIGEDYNVIFASIDPTERSPLASSVKDRYLANYGRPNEGHAAEGWAFLTDSGESAKILAESLGWTYKPIVGGEYSHPVCIFVLTPEGRIARYVYGVGYEPETMRMALLEASKGTISESIGDMIRMYCFRYDPTTGKYAVVAFRVVQLGGVASILLVGSLIGIMLTKERIRHRRSLVATEATPAKDATDTSHSAAGPTL